MQKTTLTKEEEEEEEEEEVEEGNILTFKESKQDEGETTVRKALVAKATNPMQQQQR